MRGSVEVSITLNETGLVLPLLVREYLRLKVAGDTIPPDLLYSVTREPLLQASEPSGRVEEAWKTWWRASVDHERLLSDAFPDVRSWLAARAEHRRSASGEPPLFENLDDDPALQLAAQQVFAELGNEASPIPADQGRASLLCDRVAETTRELASSAGVSADARVALWALDLSASWVLGLGRGIALVSTDLLLAEVSRKRLVASVLGLTSPLGEQWDPLRIPDLRAGPLSVEVEENGE